MIRRPPRSTRTYTLFPDTTLFRSGKATLQQVYSTVWHGGGTARRYLCPRNWTAGPVWRCLPRRNQSSIARTWRASHATGYVSKRSEEHTSELQSLMRISYAVFCLNKKKTITEHITTNKQHTS